MESSTQDRVFAGACGAAVSLCHEDVADVKNAAQAVVDELVASQLLLHRLKISFYMRSVLERNASRYPGHVSAAFQGFYLWLEKVKQNRKIIPEKIVVPALVFGEMRIFEEYELKT